MYKYNGKYMTVVHMFHLGSFQDENQVKFKLQRKRSERQNLIKEVLQKLEKFDYGESDLDHNDNLEYRPIKILENGIKYEG